MSQANTRRHATINAACSQWPMAALGLLRPMNSHAILTSQIMPAPSGQSNAGCTGIPRLKPLIEPGIGLSAFLAQRYNPPLAIFVFDLKLPQLFLSNFTPTR